MPRLIRFTLEHLEQRIRERPPGYEQAILKHASYLPDGTMEIAEAAAAEVAAEFVPTRVLNTPPTPDHVATILTRRNLHALSAWQSAGQPKRTAEQHEKLKRFCDCCPDTHCRTACLATPILRWLVTADSVGPHCLWPKDSQSGN